jgi:hypothetical protein
MHGEVSPPSAAMLSPALLQRALLPACLLLLSACVSTQLPPPSEVTRAEAIQIAKSYLRHRWTPSTRNILHGNDARGVRVDTPDIAYQPSGRAIPGWWVPGAVNEGVPYQWGGFSTLAEFDQGIAHGLAAGDVYTDAKRAGLDDAVSTQAVGIDCSGFVSRCWKLPRSYSTRELPLLCKPIKWEELKPGDILNTHNAHCLLVAGWEGANRESVFVYETGCPPTWKVASHGIDVAWLKSLGYTAWRYGGIRD